MNDTVLRLDANEGRLALSAASVAALLDEETIRRYPDSRPLEEALAARLGVSASRVLATAGADDAIDRAVRALAGPGGTVVSADPSFVEYAAAAERSGARYEPRQQVPGSLFPLGEIVKALEAERAAGRRALAIVCSPDNPGGTTVSGDQVAAIAAVGFPVLLDVTYAAFQSRPRSGAAAGAVGSGADSGAGRAQGAGSLSYAIPPSPGVITTGSLSKAYGLAGLRIGWACGPEDLIASLRAYGPPFSLSSLAIAAGVAALDVDEAALAAFIEEVRRERAILESELRRLGARTWAGEANFSTAFVADSAALASALAAEGIFVRTWPPRPSRENLVRITCPGDPGEFDRLLAALGRAKELI